MTTQFQSFGRSPLGAFKQSTCKARGPTLGTVACVNASGELIWSYDTATTVNHILRDSSQNIILATNDKLNTRKDLYKLSPSGNLLWAIQTAENGFIFDAAIDADDNIYCLTNFSMLRKYCADGTHQWSVSCSGDSVAVDSAGNVWVVYAQTLYKKSAADGSTISTYGIPEWGGWSWQYSRLMFSAGDGHLWLVGGTSTISYHYNWFKISTSGIIAAQGVVYYYIREGCKDDISGHLIFPTAAGSSYSTISEHEVGEEVPLWTYNTAGASIHAVDVDPAGCLYAVGALDPDGHNLWKFSAISGSTRSLIYNKTVEFGPKNSATWSLETSDPDNILLGCYVL